MSACLVPTVKPEPGAVKTCFILSGMTSNKPPAAVKAISPRSRVLHQFTGPPQSPNLNPAELIRDELDHTVREKQPTNPQHMWELLSVCLKRKSFRWRPHEAAWEAKQKAKGAKRCISEPEITGLIHTAVNMCSYLTSSSVPRSGTALSLSLLINH